MQGYAWEITTPEGGWGLHGVLQARQHVLNGITNGVDTAEWDPATDAHTPAPFSANDLRGKADCKAALQKELGFQVNHEVGRCWTHPPCTARPAEGVPTLYFPSEQVPEVICK